MQYWLMKSEPDVYSLADLEREQHTIWDGVRNYQARNLMRDSMQVGDQVLFYHSNARPPGVAGLATVAQTGLADPSQFDPQSPYFDPKASPDNPRWITVKLSYQDRFKRFVPLDELKAHPELSELMVIRRGARLSVQPVSAADFKLICQLGNSPGTGS
ncbi:MAG: EVE domain-containing protein [Candidatus Sericytochromatia bacterium]|nr:EVE domain-containing protein [Candidatus Sericytochromatia bacterium]